MYLSSVFIKLIHSFVTYNTLHTVHNNLKLEKSPKHTVSKTLQNILRCFEFLSQTFKTT